MTEVKAGFPKLEHITLFLLKIEAFSLFRFPKLEDCAHFHYEYAELGPLQVETL